MFNLKGGTVCTTAAQSEPDLCKKKQKKQASLSTRKTCVRIIVVRKLGKKCEKVEERVT